MANTRDGGVRTILGEVRHGRGAGLPGRVEVTSPASAPRPAWRHTWLGLTLIVLAALAIRSVLYWLRGDYLDYDESMYLLMARNLLRGEGLALNGFPHSALGPFVPVASAALSAALGVEILTAQRAISALSGALLIVPVWYLIRKQSGNRIALMAAILLVSWPALVDVTPRLLPLWRQMYAGSEPTFLFLLFASLATGEAALLRRGAAAVSRGALGGAFLALAYLTRPEALVFAGLYVIVRIGMWIRTSERPGPLAVTAGALAFLLVASPHFLYTQRVSGSWTLSGKLDTMRPSAEILQDAFREDGYLVAFARTWYRLDAGHTHLLNPFWGTPSGISGEVQKQRYARLAASETPVSRSWGERVMNRVGNYGYMLWTLCGMVFLPLVAIGAIVGIRRGFPAFAAAGLLASLFTGFHLAVLPRFFLYLVPVLSLLAAQAIDWGGARLARRSTFAPWLAIGALTAFSLLQVSRAALSEQAATLESSASDDRRAAEQLAAHLPDDEPVMHWHPRYAYWADWRWRTMPMATLEGIAHYASTLRVRHVLLAHDSFSPLDAGVPYLMIKLDDEVAARLGAITALESGPHEHPPMRLSEIPPIAGYPAGLLSLDLEVSE